MKTDTVHTMPETLEDTIGYKLAISFMPFINPKCTEHIEIVKDMAKAINKSFHSSEANGRIFNKGYLEGKNWQKEQLLPLLELNGELLEVLKEISDCFRNRRIDEFRELAPCDKKALKAIDPILIKANKLLTQNK